MSPTNCWAAARASSNVTPLMSWVATTSPSSSSVDVSVPSTTSPVYDFGTAPGYRSSLVTRPSPTNSTPVAPGSSVPAWPTRFCPKIPRHLATTSWDVHPGALSTTTRPSTTVVGGRVRCYTVHRTAKSALDGQLGPDVGQDLGDGARIGEAGRRPVTTAAEADRDGGHVEVGDRAQRDARAVHALLEDARHIRLGRSPNDVDQAL